MQTLRRRLTKNEEGFTLIELMVVVLIIAILIAIAIPTFLGAQNRARDRGAQSDLRNALTAAKTVATDQAGAFMWVDPDDGVLKTINADGMFASEPSLTFDDTTSSTSAILVDTATGGTQITLEKVSASGNVFGIRATDQGVVSYCRANDGDPGDCSGATAVFVGEPW